MNPIDAVYGGRAVKLIDIRFNDDWADEAIVVDENDNIQVCPLAFVKVMQFHNELRQINEVRTKVVT